VLPGTTDRERDLTAIVEGYEHGRIDDILTVGNFVYSHDLRSEVGNCELVARIHDAVG
jgi:hypothetical protein